MKTIVTFTPVMILNTPSIAIPCSPVTARKIKIESGLYIIAQSCYIFF